MSRQGRKRVRPVTVAATSYDRRSIDLPINSVVSEAVVDDPLEKGATLILFRSLRDDPLAGMLAKGQIDDAMFAAGRLWQTYHEYSQIGGVRAIDPAKEAVDGGKLPEVITLRQMEASDKLAEAKKALGFQGITLVRCILGERMTVQQTAMRLGLCSEREFNYISRRFRECLETLAVLWGYASRKQA